MQELVGFCLGLAVLGMARDNGLTTREVVAVCLVLLIGAMKAVTQ